MARRSNKSKPVVDPAPLVPANDVIASVAVAERAADPVAEAIPEPVPLIDWTSLEARVDELRAQWNKDGPIRHFTLDGFLLPGMCDELADFSAMDGKLAGPASRRHKHVRGKFGLPRPEQMTALQRQFFDEVNADRFLRLIERITDIPTLYPDANLNGGGLHQIRRGGYLNVHADFNFDPETGRNRRLNLLLYLNKEWSPEWEGQIQLWTDKLDRPIVSLDPIMNRILVFETTETSLHGHPEPLNVPEGLTRKSMAVYYYSDWPEELDRRSRTAYKLTRRQWAQLIAKISKIISNHGATEERVLASLGVHYQTSDIKNAYRMLMQLESAPLTPEEYWEAPDGRVSLRREDDSKKAGLDFSH